MTAQDRLEYIISHRGEPECNIYISEIAKKMDAEIVEETLCHIWAGFYDAIPQEELLAEKIRKNNNAIRRERKLADNKAHQRKLMLKKGRIVNE